MKYYLIIIFFIITNIVFAQNTKLIIIDRGTNLPIALASIYTQRGVGSYSSEDGSAVLNINTNDTLYIKHLSYNEVILTYEDIKHLANNTIYLSPKIIELQQVVVKPQKLKKISLGYYNENTLSNKATPGGISDFEIFTNHIKNTTGGVGLLNKLHFDLHVDLTEKSNSSVRIRVFSVGKDGLPDQDMLTKEIIKKVDRFTPNIHIDVSEFKIPFPPEGVFIGLEFFCTFRSVTARRENHLKIITNCPHVPVSKVSNADEVGHSYNWTLHNKKFEWFCRSDGSVYRGLKGNVYKFGADVLIN
ncbi:peptidase associated/transthyretin-like domain-containing protein [Flectobacillus roseus]|uniref:Carboxypeptidase-like regulatory domain-containing protein n=1 Tax=Flectobacillus roseus TaxID=502259 RepID=A0ABT6YER9_9BACT|nr:hypothetical protein [Flectobacillus roseus]MDI9861927.1 hypothetical protein [Flectobacillus roseus]MDI9871379.1 hypothetical protein [Flectobacillus roseus]